MMKTENFEPKIVAFLCNWCSYTAADLAGTARTKYAHNVRIIRVMCTGRIDPTLVMKSFHAGADGVLISGCHPGECHYQGGNIKCLRRVILIKKLLTQFGIEKERLRLIWASAAEGEKIAEEANDMTGVIRNLGPLELERIEGVTNVET
jgi:F420-non-reducing hydrogenase iron-sulfur subunit